MSEPKQISCTEIDCFRKLVRMLKEVGFSTGDESPETLTEIIASMMFDNVDALREILKEQHQRKLEAEVAAEERDKYFQELGRFGTRPLNAPVMARTRKITQPYTLGDTFAEIQTLALTPDMVKAAKERLQNIIDYDITNFRPSGLYDAWKVIAPPSIKPDATDPEQ